MSGVGSCDSAAHLRGRVIAPSPLAGEGMKRAATYSCWVRGRPTARDSVLGATPHPASFLTDADMPSPARGEGTVMRAPDDEREQSVARCRFAKRLEIGDDLIALGDRGGRHERRLCCDRSFRSSRRIRRGGASITIGTSASSGATGTSDGAASACSISSAVNSPRARRSYSLASSRNSSRARGVFASSARRRLASAFERRLEGSCILPAWPGLVNQLITKSGSNA